MCDFLGVAENGQVEWPFYFAFMTHLEGLQDGRLQAAR